MVFKYFNCVSTLHKKKLPMLAGRLDFHFQPKQLSSYLEDRKDILQFLNQFQVRIQILEDVLGSTVG